MHGYTWEIWYRARDFKLHTYSMACCKSRSHLLSTLVYSYRLKFRSKRYWVRYLCVLPFSLDSAVTIDSTYRYINTNRCYLWGRAAPQARKTALASNDRATRMEAIQRLNFHQKNYREFKIRALVYTLIQHRQFHWRGHLRRWDRIW